VARRRQAAAAENANTADVFMPCIEGAVVDGISTYRQRDCEPDTATA
jgi:hypothetical protein